MTEGTATERKRVLIVDDGPTIRAAAAAALQAEFDVLACESGIDAIASMVEFVPDLVLLDIVMPGLDGYETVSILRMNPRFASIPILMMSSKGSILDVARARLVGFSGELLKPFEQEQLLSVVRSALAAESQVAQAAA